VNSFDKGDTFARQHYKPGVDIIEEAIYTALKDFSGGHHP